MIKNTVIALVAVATFAGAAAPAFAESIFGDNPSEATRQFTSNSIISQLQQRGINVSSVEDYNGLVRAYVTLEDGKQAMQFYTPDSLVQVAL
ncbi:MAG: hypothetical protein JWQ22_2997 [Devosia sp.]|nr:hypothetical protein [Devosia sp.]